MNDAYTIITNKSKIMKYLLAWKESTNVPLDIRWCEPTSAAIHFSIIVTHGEYLYWDGETSIRLHVLPKDQHYTLHFDLSIVDNLIIEPSRLKLTLAGFALRKNA